MEHALCAVDSELVVRLGLLPKLRKSHAADVHCVGEGTAFARQKSDADGCNASLVASLL